MTEEECVDRKCNKVLWSTGVSKLEVYFNDIDESNVSYRKWKKTEEHIIKKDLMKIFIRQMDRKHTTQNNITIQQVQKKSNSAANAIN